jgi:membrane fusion protein, copper/silver efflux system
VSYDETRIAHIHTRISGWIDKLYVDYTGMLVKKGQPLLTLYSPELVSTQQELLIARKAKDALGTSSFTTGVGSNAFSLYESTRERLRLWDIPESEIREIEKRGTPNKNLTLYSPIDGFVVTRNGFSGHRVTPEMELYSIADLSTIWAFAEVYEYELPMIKVGQNATMTLSSFPGRSFTGKVKYIYPGLEAATRTLKVRLEFSNPGFELKPDMYANVELKVDYGMQLAVPRDAVLDAGTVQIVFVAREGGYFEPRKVSLGEQVGDQVIVLSGIKGGEQVVTSANFLVDSESQLKAALGSLTVGEHTSH